MTGRIARPNFTAGLVTKRRTTESPEQKTLRLFVAKWLDPDGPLEGRSRAFESLLGHAIPKAIDNYLRGEHGRRGRLAHVASRADAKVINDMRLRYEGAGWWDGFGACESCQAIFEIKRARAEPRRQCPDCVGDDSRHNEDESPEAAARRTSNLPKWIPEERRVDYDICLGCLVFGPPPGREMGQAKLGALYAPGHDACRKRVNRYLAQGGSIEAPRGGGLVRLRPQFRK
jgi:hypothetical protein